MIELSQLDLVCGAARVGFAGDTLNTATYLARLGAKVSYVTNLGKDAFSDRMVEVCQSEGIDTSLIGRHASRLPGIYSIETDPTGERSFRYWRDTSAARTLFSGIGATLADLAAFDVIYLSGITLAILPPQIRTALIDAAARLKTTGKKVVFDTNYRPRLWADEDAARSGFTAMWHATTLGLPSFDDEQTLHPGLTPNETVQRIAELGPSEIVLKNGAEGPLIWRNGLHSCPAFSPAAKVVDTSGAGDSFNAGYLAARLSGANPCTAAGAGHALATQVIAHHGAIIPREAMPATA